MRVHAQYRPYVIALACWVFEMNLAAAGVWETVAERRKHGKGGLSPEPDHAMNSHSGGQEIRHTKEYFWANVLC